MDLWPDHGLHILCSAVAAFSSYWAPGGGSGGGGPRASGSGMSFRQRTDKARKQLPINGSKNYQCGERIMRIDGMKGYDGPLQLLTAMALRCRCSNPHQRGRGPELHARNVTAATADKSWEASTHSTALETWTRPSRATSSRAAEQHGGRDAADAKAAEDQGKKKTAPVREERHIDMLFHIESVLPVSHYRQFVVTSLGWTRRWSPGPPRVQTQET